MFPDAKHPQPQFWLILGQGRVIRGPGLYSQRIEIVAAPLKDGERALAGNYDPSRLMLEHASTTRVPVDLFGIFGIGDVWFRDRPVGAVSFERRVLTLRYAPERLSFVEAGLNKMNPSEKRWLIPPDRFPLAELFPESQLVAISDGRYPYRYLVPALTLMPFYYGGSSELNRALFRPGFGKPTNPVFSPNETRVIGNDLHLYLLPGIPLEDARLVAPWTTDYGIKQVARIYESLLLRAASGLDGNTRTFPPFLGEERLTVQGIKLAGGKLERFLILRIESGSLPVPYDRIIVSNPEHAERVRDETDAPEDEPPTGGGSPSKKEKKVDEISGTDPPAPGPRTTIHLPSAERFRDTPVIERQKRRVPPTPRRPPPKKAEDTPDPPDEVTEQGAVGEPGFGTGKKVVVRQKTEATKPTNGAQVRGVRSPVFAEFHEYLDALDGSLTEPHTILVLPELAADDGDACASFFPLKHGQEEGYHAWYYRQVSRRRRRKLLVALARYKDAWFTLLEAENKPFEEFQLGVVYSGGRPPNHGALVNLAAAAAANRCIWEEGAVGAMAVRKQKHTWEDAEEFTATITALFEAMIA